MDTPPVVKRRPRPSRKANRNAKYVAYALAAIGITALIFGANYAHVLKLRATMIHRSMVESRFLQDPRFQELRVAIDTDSGLAVVSGTVATNADLDALRKLLKLNRAPTGTYWRLAVTVLNAAPPRPAAASTAPKGADF